MEELAALRRGERNPPKEYLIPAPAIPTIVDDSLSIPPLSTHSTAPSFSPIQSQNPASRTLPSRNHSMPLPSRTQSLPLAPLTMEGIHDRHRLSALSRPVSSHSTLVTSPLSAGSRSSYPNYPLPYQSHAMGGSLVSTPTSSSRGGDGSHYDASFAHGSNGSGGILRGLMSSERDSGNDLARSQYQHLQLAQHHARQQEILRQSQMQQQQQQQDQRRQFHQHIQNEQQQQQMQQEAMERQIQLQVEQHQTRQLELSNPDSPMQETKFDFDSPFDFSYADPPALPPIFRDLFDQAFPDASSGIFHSPSPIAAKDEGEPPSNYCPNDTIDDNPPPLPGGKLPCDKPECDFETLSCSLPQPWRPAALSSDVTSKATWSTSQGWAKLCSHSLFIKCNVVRHALSLFRLNDPRDRSLRRTNFAESSKIRLVALKMVD
jgi:hypothetical protein